MNSYKVVGWITPKAEANRLPASYKREAWIKAGGLKQARDVFTRQMERDHGIVAKITRFEQYTITDSGQYLHRKTWTL
jgi:ribosomal protein L16/L10AE